MLRTRLFHHHLFVASAVATARALVRHGSTRANATSNVVCRTITNTTGAISCTRGRRPASTSTNSDSSTSPSPNTNPAPAVPAEMRAVVCRQVGGDPDLLEYEWLPVPTPRDDEVLIRVHAASINSLDASLRRGNLPATLTTRPSPLVLGIDCSGEVVATGKQAFAFKPGDLVFGCADARHGGTHAEFVTLPESDVARKPIGLSHIEAAAVAFTNATITGAILGIRPNERVLIHSVTTNEGWLLAHLLQRIDCHLIGTESSTNIELAETLGLEQVINYETDDVAAVLEGGAVNTVIDTTGSVENGSAFDVAAVLREGGTLFHLNHGLYEELCSQPFRALGHFGREMASSFRTIRRRTLMPSMDFTVLRVTGNHLARLSNTLDKTGMRPVRVERVFPLDQSIEAFQYFETGETHGKVVINVSNIVEDAGDAGDAAASSESQQQ